MKKNIIFSILLILIMSMIVACSNEEAIMENSLGDKLNSVNKKTVTFSEATMDGVSVLIFGHNNSKFQFLRSIDAGWSASGTSKSKVSTYLEIGTYKFLFLKNEGKTTKLTPSLLGAGPIYFENIKIESTEDSQNPGWLAPVDEIWLPETDAVANKTYAISDSVTIFNKLKRAVSQVQLNIKRALPDGEKQTPYPFEEGESIMENIKEIKMEIEGVGEYITIYGGNGTSKTKYNATSASKIDDDGYAIFNGPFVFPNGTGEDAMVNIIIEPIDENVFPRTTATAKGPLEKNRKLEITLWLTPVYKFINITIDTKPISGNKDGDTGIWE